MSGPYDWAILDIFGVQDIVRQAASKVARQFELDVDDVAQEARIRVCDVSTNLPECARGLRGLHLGTLQYRLEQDLVDVARTEVRRRNRNTSHEQRYAPTIDGESSRPYPASIVIRHEVDGYTRELVEALIPAVWDESFCYGMRVENAPDSDMPRGSTNKATGNTLAAHIADIKAAWKKATLTLRQQRALLLAYGLDWTEDQVGYNQGVTQQAISGRLTAGVAKLVAVLGGSTSSGAEVIPFPARRVDAFAEAA